VFFFNIGGFHHANTPHATPLSQNLSMTLYQNNKKSLLRPTLRQPKIQFFNQM